MRTTLQNSYTVGHNKHPANMTKLLSMMNNWKVEPSGNRHSNRFLTPRHEDGDELNFSQDGKPVVKAVECDNRRTGVSMVQSTMKQGRGRKVAF